ncbi:uncharacterized protein LOC62_04G005243 [Vanrija pseudolonga]|uniref:Uncharacterized protein n=1 Tax=Vanrija pseudolonga TaxID=143232 RepID=A0AAF0Y9A4_9TREE|nr:hypothetical protein LOC62_04G005243 [Vanrija pseudolonga]
MPAVRYTTYRKTSASLAAERKPPPGKLKPATLGPNKRRALGELESNARSAAVASEGINTHAELKMGYKGKNQTHIYYLITPVTAGFVPQDKSAYRLPYTPRDIEVLDIRDVEWESLPAVRINAFKRLDTVRRFNLFQLGGGPQDWFTQATTTVDFVHLNDVSSWKRKDTGAATEPIHLPPNTTRHVLHVAWDQSSMAWSRGLRFCANAKVRDKAPAVRDKCPEFLSNLIEKITTALKKGCKLTVVGAETAAAGQFGKPAGSKRGVDTTAAVREHFYAYWKAKCPEKTRFKLDDGTRFLTMDEFAAELGDRADIEGRWPPKRTRLCGTCGKKVPVERYSRCSCGRGEESDDARSEATVDLVSDDEAP